MNLSYLIKEIDCGPAGTAQTMQAARALVIEAQTDPIVRSMALRIRNGAMCCDSAEYGRALWAWLRRKVWLVNEAVELLQPPDFMLHQIELYGHADGDCDDVATLGAALVVVFGIPARFVCIRPIGTADYLHIFVEIFVRGSWYILDPTVKNIPDQTRFDRLILEI